MRTSVRKFGRFSINEIEAKIGTDRETENENPQI
jgi:hypothetical protein